MEAKPVVTVERFAPKANWLSVLPDPVQQVTESGGGIILPDIVQGIAVPRTGVVRSVGPDVKDVHEGERVLFSAYGGTLVRVAGEDLLVMMDESVIAGI